MITLTHSEARATINPKGAWVEALHVDEQALLFPRTELQLATGETKSRGGAHVCLPNFGPGGDSGLAQHGFGRTEGWEVARQTDDTVQLILRGVSSPYTELEAKLVYSLDAQQFSSELTLKNHGSSALRVAPGFHPYFSLEPSETTVALNDTVYALDSLAGTVFVEAGQMKLATSTFTVTLSQTGLPLWAIWTDRSAPFVCVEPTVGGYRFLETPTADEQLAPGTEKSFSYTVEWQE